MPTIATKVHILLEKYKKVRDILIERNENNESLYLCNITWNIMQDEELYDDLTDRLLVYRSLEKIVPCSKNVRNIKHSYCYEASTSVANYYSFRYNLTPAIRWANRQIDDFTLILDIGDFEYFNLNKTFYNDKNDWIINGIGNAFDKESSIFGD